MVKQVRSTQKYTGMKTLLTSIVLFLSLAVNAQQKDFLIEGQVVDQFGNAIQDVYVVNLNSHEKDISRKNGVFTVWVSPSDSLVLSHIAYFRKIVSVHTLLVNPTVTLLSEDVNIPEIQVSTNQLSEYDRAKKNVSFLEDYEVPAYTKIDNDADAVSEMMVENNRLMRSEASSVRIVAFSPSEQIHQFYSLFKKKDSHSDYSSTRKVKKPPVKKDDD